MTADVLHFHNTRGLAKRMGNLLRIYTTMKKPAMSVSRSQRHDFLQYYLFQNAMGQMGKETYVNKVDLMIS